MPLATMRGLSERQSSEPMLARIEEEEQESDYLHGKPLYSYAPGNLFGRFIERITDQPIS